MTEPVSPGRPGRGRRPAARESILDAIRAAEQLSRVELAALTGLTEAAVSMTVRRLLDEGVVVETGRTPTGGKPRTMLRLDPTARLAVGVHLDHGITTFVLTGQTGGVVSRLARPAPAGDLITHLTDGIGTLLAASGVDRPRCLGVGVVWPGPTGFGPTTAARSATDTSARSATTRSASTTSTRSATTRSASTPSTRSATTRSASTTSARAATVTSTRSATATSTRSASTGPFGPPEVDVPAHLSGWDAGELGRRLAEETGWPVLVENDATAAAVGEYWVARIGPERAFAALYLGSALGAGIVVDGRAMRGRHGTAGEFGHLCLRMDGPQCWCGSHGCLEVLAGPRAVVAAARTDPAAAAEAGLGPLAARGVAADFAAVARAARSGRPRCLALLEDSARYVAAAAESVVNLLDVDLLVLTGPGFAAASFVYGPAIMHRIHPADSRTWRRSVTVTVSLAAATASATGAAALVLQSHLRR